MNGYADKIEMINGARNFNLLDGATGEVEAVYREVDEQRRIAADSTCPLEDRLASYEDIIDSEVGDTTMVRARNIEREYGFRQLYLKFEGGNPTGTQKDRIAFTQAMMPCDVASMSSPWPVAVITGWPWPWPHPWPVFIV